MATVLFWLPRLIFTSDRYGKPVANLMMKVHALVASFPGLVMT